VSKLRRLTQPKWLWLTFHRYPVVECQVKIQTRLIKFVNNLFSLLKLKTKHNNFGTALTFIKLCGKPNKKGILNMKHTSYLSHLPGHRLNNLGFNSQQGQEIFLLSNTSRLAQGAHPHLLFNGYWVSSSRIKLAWHEADHLPPSSAKVKNEWIYTSTPPCMTLWCTQAQLYSLASLQTFFTLINIYTIMLETHTETHIGLSRFYPKLK
jgi:hypothetical protein